MTERRREKKISAFAQQHCQFAITRSLYLICVGAESGPRAWNELSTDITTPAAIINTLHKHLSGWASSKQEVPGLQDESTRGFDSKCSLFHA